MQIRNEELQKSLCGIQWLWKKWKVWLLFICVWELLISQISLRTGILPPFFGATMSITRYLQKGTLTCMTWRDRKPVSFLGTVPTSEDDSGVVERSVKVNGHWLKQNIARPGMVSLFNAYMGGVDVSDQRVSSNARLMRSAVWCYKIFFYLIEVCVSNAHILERKSPSHTTLDFQKVNDKWLDWRKVLQERHSNAAATHSWN